jgi:hypothetical protein
MLLDWPFTGDERVDMRGSYGSSMEASDALIEKVLGGWSALSALTDLRHPSGNLRLAGNRSLRTRVLGWMSDSPIMGSGLKSVPMSKLLESIRQTFDLAAHGKLYLPTKVVPLATVAENWEASVCGSEMRCAMSSLSSVQIAAPSSQSSQFERDSPNS